MQKFTKKLLIVIITVIMCAVIIVGCTIGGLAIAHNIKLNSNNELSLIGEYENVILLIGDGMGFNHISVGKASVGADSFGMETRAKLSGDVTTFSRNYGEATDSAAAATALSTGVKVSNGEVSRHKGKDIVTNMERAIKKGMSTGVIAAEGVKGATPAGFSAHSDNRDDLDDILSSQLKSSIDLFMDII